MTGQTDNIRPLVAGNWKMNGLRADIAEVQALKAALGDAGKTIPADVMIAPPATLIAAFAALSDGAAPAIAAQDCHAKQSGANTGDISAEMLADAGATAVIVGHSERRSDHGESSADVKAKAGAAHRAGLTAIVCVGESRGERDAGLTLNVVMRQLKDSLPQSATAANTVIAYEPVWAIGTGLVPSAGDVAEVHAAIRADLVRRFADEGRAMRILYGGSVKADNARELLAIANVNGALVGGASLKASDFLAIVRTYERG